MNHVQKPLEGIKVVELATYVAAPTCCKLLADLGAEVIKVEPPAGDAWRYNHAAPGDDNPRFDICNSGKKGIVLNLKQESAMCAMMRVLEDADVFVTNVRPASLERLQLDHKTIRAKFPRMIYASLTGYGEKGPDVNLPGFDTAAYWARSGFSRDMSISTGNNYPVDTPVGAGDTVTGAVLYSSILAALLSRERTGMGDYVTAALYNVGIWVVSGSIAVAQTPTASFPRTRDKCLPEATAYKCKCGDWIQLCVLEPGRYSQALFEELGHPGILDDPRFSTPEARYRNNRELVELAEEAFAEKTVDEWLDIMKSRDIVCCRVAHFVDIPKCEQAWANDFVEKVSYPSGKEVVVPVSPVRMDSIGVNRLAHAPKLGEDTAEVLGRLGYSEGEIALMG